MDVWKMTLSEFIGNYPIQDDEPQKHILLSEKERRLARQIMTEGQAWNRLMAHRVNNSSFYIAPLVDAPEDITLLHQDPITLDWTLVGGYIGSALWIQNDDFLGTRGKGLGIKLVIEKASRCQKSDWYPESYTTAGLAVHKAAHKQIVLRAIANGLPVPTEIAKEYL
jgi:hypothetical protein